MTLPFLKDFRKAMDKMATVTTNFSPPTHWFSTGNMALNKSLSGSYLRGVPIGRVTVFAGESGAGKSFLCGNTIRSAQEDGAFILVIDSENAMDQGFLTALGVDVSPDKLMYVGVVTIQDVTAVLSEFITGYEKEYGKDNPEAPKVLHPAGTVALGRARLLGQTDEEQRLGVRIEDAVTRLGKRQHLAIVRRGIEFHQLGVRQGGELVRAVEHLAIGCPRGDARCAAFEGLTLWPATFDGHRIDLADAFVVADEGDGFSIGRDVRERFASCVGGETLGGSAFHIRSPQVAFGGEDNGVPVNRGVTIVSPGAFSVDDGCDKGESKVEAHDGW